MLISVLSIIVSCAGSDASDAPDKLFSTIKGRWDVFVPEAFPGFQNYDLTIRDTDQTIDIKSEEFDVKRIKFIYRNGRLSANLYINGVLEKAVIWEENGVIKGLTETDIGDIDWVFKKVE